MARVPPSNLGPKHHGVRPGQRGPASTRTLTTNTFTTTTGVSSVLHDPSVPRTYLFDIYKNEAESHFEIGEYRLAADCYNAAIKLQPNDTSAIVARSRCYAQLGRWKRAMRDCDEALGIDAACSQALYHKADILYINGNHDMALVYFKRALRLQPESILFKQAVQKTMEAINRSGGTGGPKPNKLTAVGDLSLFLHNKKRITPRDKETPRLVDESDKLELPSAGFRARFNVAPLIRINRKPGVSILKTYRSESAMSGSSAGSTSRVPSEPTMRTILGELYGDRKYLKKFQNNLPGGKAERDLTLLADEGLEFLRERTIFWDSLGPLPPPQVPKRSNMRERSFFFGSTESVNADMTYTPCITISEEQQNYQPETKLQQLQQHNPQQQQYQQQEQQQPEGRKLNMPRRLKKKKKKLEVLMGLERDCTSIKFEFLSLNKNSPRSASQLDSHPEDGLLPILRETGRGKSKGGRPTFVGLDSQARDRKRELTKFVNREMDNIDEAFKTGEFEECREKAEACLRTVSDLEGEEINKSEVLASLHSCLGNASIALNDFDRALTHHMEALTIGETEHLHEVINRSLGHLGRMYIIQKRFNKALEVFARKAPTVVSAEEVAQVFHEIGNCFLALGHLDYARDCGKKALRAAQEADIHYFKFQSWVLIAVSESRMKHHDEAYKAFQKALELARHKDDQESVTVILYAMEHLSKTITSIMKKREILNERLSTRSKTQAIIDLNKRPHAARQKKRKKKLRRETTSMDDDNDDDDDDALTRQNTMFELERDGRGDKAVAQASDAKQDGRDGQDQEASDPFKRESTVMFEENPRELEPFGDPHIRSQRHHKDRQTPGGTQKRHGVLSQLDTDRSRTNSREHFNLDVSREHSDHQLEHGDIPRLDLGPRTPRTILKMDSSREMNRSHSKRDTPREVMGRSHQSSRAEGSQLSTYRSGGHAHHDVSGVLSETGTPRMGRGHCHLDRGDSRLEDGKKHGGTRMVRDVNNGDLKPEINEGRQDGQRSDRRGSGGGGGLSGQYFRNKSGLKEQFRLDDSHDNVNQDETNVTGVSSRPGLLNSGRDDLTPGRLADLSATQESADWRTPIGDYSYDGETPRANYSYEEIHQSGKHTGREESITPRDQGHATGRSPRGHHLNISQGGYRQGGQGSPRHHKARRGSKEEHLQTGRFTRESYFDEDGHTPMVEGNSLDVTKSPELVSVSRQHLVREQKTTNGADVLDRRCAQEREGGGPGGGRDERRLNDRPTSKHACPEGSKDKVQEDHTLDTTIKPSALERRSSKVSLRGPNNEEATVTLETTRPYRVSSAASARSDTLRSARERENQADSKIHKEATLEVELPKEDNVLGKHNSRRGLREEKSQNDLALPDVVSPIKSQNSALTTGSGWEGDVSVESGFALPLETRSKSMKKRSSPNESVAADDDASTKGHELSNRSRSRKNKTQSDERLEHNTNSQISNRTEGAGVNLTPKGSDILNESGDGTLVNLTAGALKDDIIRTTSEATLKEKEHLLLVKEAHRGERNAKKAQREFRELDDIQSVPYSSNPDLDLTVRTHRPTGVRPPSLDTDPALSMSLPAVSHVTSDVTEDDRPLGPLADKP